MRKILFAILCVGTGMAACAAVSVRSYVQDGLIGQYDGIDNVGTGVHDASATVWKDLAGTIGDFTVNTACASFTGGNALKKDNNGYMARNLTRSPDIRTIEVAASDIPASGWVMAFFAGAKQYLSLSDDKFAGFRTYFTDYNNYGVKTTLKPTALTATATYSLATVGLRVYQSGARTTGDVHQNNWNDSGNNDMSIGGRSSAGGGELAIKGYSFHSVRLYNRPLTADEVAANALVDAVRFRGASEADLDAALKPYGFRLAADGTLKRRAVLKCCTASGHTDGSFTVYGQLRGHQEGSTAVSLFWGTSADALDHEVAVATLDVSARPPTFSKNVQATAGGTIYWKLRSVNTQGAVAYTNETEAAELRCAFLPAALPTPVCTIDVAQGVTTNLRAWLTAEGASAPSGAGSIVKTGKGTLVISDDVITNFSGNVYICAGGRIQVQTPCPFGISTDGAVYVEKGATLYHYWPSGVTSAPTFGAKPVYIEGAGTDGNGAIYCRMSGGDGKTIGEPGVVRLSGDARIGYTGNQSYQSGKVYLQGHTWALQSSVDWSYPQQALYDDTEAGHVYQANSVLFNGLSVKFGDPDNYWVLGGTWLRANGHVMATPLTLVMKAGTGFYTGRSTSCWRGPVYLEAGDHNFNRQFDDNPSWKFTGIVSGPGRIGKAGAGSTLSGIRLDNGYNDFTGGVYLHTTEYINIGVNGSLPKDGGALTCSRGRVEFNTAGPYELPEAVFAATGLVRSVSGVARATGTWKKVTKTEAGTLVYDCSVGAPVLDVTGGTFEYPAADAVAPSFGAITVAAGAVLDANGHAIVAETLGGAGTVRGDVELATGFRVAAVPGTALAVEGTLTFASAAKVLVADDVTLGSTVHTLATATGGITAARLTTDRKNVFARVEGNALTLFKCAGASVIVR